ncbi:hypothetical protein JI739_20930 [Ramlibacter sp. AW1]|uniref:Uncharacterized protein n=1 Tax=Ramlibacter aurantiacus TaxID=2801330 RepID=A0A937D891_9BURK|nr:hypothetical protein [Ramlibacter aurantiacus]MBL0422813.1 hypothetical protein [Ramlibacter aurantiacus]
MNSVTWALQCASQCVQAASVRRQGVRPSPCDLMAIAQLEQAAIRWIGIAQRRLQYARGGIPPI